MRELDVPELREIFGQVEGIAREAEQALAAVERAGAGDARGAADTRPALADVESAAGDTDCGQRSASQRILAQAVGKLKGLRSAGSTAGAGVLDLVGLIGAFGEELALRAALETTRILARADGSLAQIPQSHFVFSRYLRPEQTDLRGSLIANAQVGAPGVELHTLGERTAKRQTAGQRTVLSGAKRFCTGSIYADALAVVVEAGRSSAGAADKSVVFVPADAPGVTIHDNWSAIGQSFTGSGVVEFREVDISDAQLLPLTVAGPFRGAFAQALHAAIDLGLLEGAVNAAYRLAGFPVDVEKADPLLHCVVGEVELALFSAQSAYRALHDSFAEAFAADHGGEAVEQQLARSVSLAKLAIQDQALPTLPRLFEVTGTAGCASSSVIDRRWRDLRVHTLHDRRRAKVNLLGRRAVGGLALPLDGKLGS